MRVRLLLAALGGAAMVFSFSCAKDEVYRDRPVPAVLSDRDALELADAFVAQRNLDWGPARHLQAAGWGYWMVYQTPLDTELGPPRTSHLVAVHHDGTVYEWPTTEE